MGQIYKLPVQVTKNGLPYNLIQRNDLVALFGIGGFYYAEKIHYEVTKIIKTRERELFGRMTPARESIVGNEEFGKEGSKMFVDRDQAEDYFQELTAKIKASGKGSDKQYIEKNSTQEGYDTTREEISSMQTTK